jgi:hypothetical protein
VKQTSALRGLEVDVASGHKHLQRDAMILAAHAREGRDIFVSNDTKASGRPREDFRNRLQKEFGIRAMTLEEFKDYCSALRSGK